MIVGAGFWYGHWQREQHLLSGRIADVWPEADADPNQVPRPLIMLLLDVSGSLPNRNDPENRESLATKTLLRLVHHFTLEGNFSPRVGIVTFGASASWLEVDGRRIWSLESADSLDAAISSLDATLGGVGAQDRRAGTYTDYNGALELALEELKALDDENSPLVVMMTDGGHTPWPGHQWNHDKQSKFDIDGFRKLIRSKALAAIDTYLEDSPQLRSLLRKRVESQSFDATEPHEFLSKLNHLDQELIELLRNSVPMQASFKLIQSAFRQEVVVDRDVSDIAMTLDEANARLRDELIPRLSESAELQIVGLNSKPLESIRNLQDGDPADFNMLQDLEKLIEVAGSRPATLHWSDDAGLTDKFVGIFEGWLRLLTRNVAIADSPQIEIRGGISSLAILVDAAQPFQVLDPDNVPLTPSSFVDRLFLVEKHHLKQGNYSVSGSDGTARILMQAEPLFLMIPESEVVQPGGRPPFARIVAYSITNGRKVPLHKLFTQVPEQLTSIVSGTSPAESPALRWVLTRDDDRKPLHYSIDAASWPVSIWMHPGRYTADVKIDGFVHLDGTRITPRSSQFTFEIRPGVVITVRDAESHEQQMLNFAPRIIHW